MIDTSVFIGRQDNVMKAIIPADSGKIMGGKGKGEEVVILVLCLPIIAAQLDI